MTHGGPETRTDDVISYGPTEGRGSGKASDANNPDDDHDHRSGGTLHQLQVKDHERAASSRSRR